MVLWLFFFGSREENVLALGRQLELNVCIKLNTFMHHCADRAVAYIEYIGILSGFVKE